MVFFFFPYLFIIDYFLKIPVCFTILLDTSCYYSQHIDLLSYFVLVSFQLGVCHIYYLRFLFMYWFLADIVWFYPASSVSRALILELYVIIAFDGCLLCVLQFVWKVLKSDWLTWQSPVLEERLSVKVTTRHYSRLLLTLQAFFYKVGLHDERQCPWLHIGLTA